MKSELTWHDMATRLVILLCGGIAATLLVLEGVPEAVPALAIGGSLGALLIRSFEVRD